MSAIRSLRLLLALAVAIVATACCPESTIESEEEQYRRYIKVYEEYLSGSDLGDDDKEWLRKEKEGFEEAYEGLPADGPERLSAIQKLTPKMRAASLEARERAAQRKKAGEERETRKAQDQADKEAAKLDDYKREFVGRWTGDGVDLTITPTYGVEYERRKGASTTSVNGPIKTFSKGSFTVSVFGISTTFVIDKPPHTDDAHTRMKIDGVVLTRVEAQ